MDVDTHVRMHMGSHDPTPRVHKKDGLVKDQLAKEEDMLADEEEGMLRR